jgi:hypothetical protein
VHPLSGKSRSNALTLLFSAVQSIQQDMDCCLSVPHMRDKRFCKQEYSLSQLLDASIASKHSLIMAENSNFARTL